jgi:hypothetical protein
MRSTSMSSSHLQSENGLPLRWPICMASSTCMSPPSPVGRSRTRTTFTWMTARSSTSAHSISPEPNSPTRTIPVAWTTGISQDVHGNSHGLTVNFLRLMPPHEVAALGLVASDRGDGWSEQNFGADERLSLAGASSRLSSSSWLLWSALVVEGVFGRFRHIPDPTILCRLLPPTLRSRGGCRALPEDETSEENTA